MNNKLHMGNNCTNVMHQSTSNYGHSSNATKAVAITRKLLQFA